MIIKKTVVEKTNINKRNNSMRAQIRSNIFEKMSQLSANLDKAARAAIQLASKGISVEMACRLTAEQMGGINPSLVENRFNELRVWISF